jgi:putative transcriptional regulator
MNAAHHASASTLASYVAGALDEARSVVVATHLSMCSDCRAAFSGFEALAGIVLESIDGAPMAVDALDRFWLRAEPQNETVRAPSAAASNDIEPEYAPALARAIPGGIDAVRWRRVSPGVMQSILKAQGYRKGALRLLKIEAGTRIPKHTHQGGELTLILRGAYEDSIGVFSAGDLADLDDEATHSPLAIGEEPCICLIATSAPLVFKDLAARAMQPFVGL